MLDKSGKNEVKRGLVKNMKPVRMFFESAGTDNSV
jgi:hypothetical protein